MDLSVRKGGSFEPSNPPLPSVRACIPLTEGLHGDEIALHQTCNISSLAQLDLIFVCAYLMYVYTICTLYHVYISLIVVVVVCVGSRTSEGKG